MAIDGIVSSLQKRGGLKRFTRGLPRGTARGLYETISQIAASAIDPEALKNGADALDSGILKDKVSDLAEIYAEYKRFLTENGYVDESGYLALLPEYLKSTGRTFGRGRILSLLRLVHGAGGKNAESGVRGGG